MPIRYRHTTRPLVTRAVEKKQPRRRTTSPAWRFFRAVLFFLIFCVLAAVAFPKEGTTMSPVHAGPATVRVVANPLGGGRQRTYEATKVTVGPKRTVIRYEREGKTRHATFDHGKMNVQVLP